MTEQHAHRNEGVSFKSLDSESIGAARAAARASGLSLEDWLSRTILESVRARGDGAGGDGGIGYPDQPAWAITRDDPDQTIDAITRHLIEAQAAADQAGVSVAEWLSRTILESAQDEQEAANNNIPVPVDSRAGYSPGTTNAGDYAYPGGASDESVSQEDRLAEIIASRRAELEEEERAKQPDLLAGLEMPDRPMTLTKNMQMPSNLPQFEGERRRRFPWLWLCVMMLMVAVAGMIWVVPHLPGPSDRAATETTVGVGGTVAGAPSKPKDPPAAGGEKAPAAKDGGAQADARPPAKSPDPAAGADKKPAAAAKKPESTLPPATETRLSKLPKPIGEHLAWYKSASDAGNATAQFALGSYYIRKKDMPAAAAMMRKAADKGHAEAQYTLGALYAYGLGLPKSDVDAVLMYKKAADQGYVPAITEVGLAYLHGRGVERNLTKALTFLERAGEANEPNAQYTLGRLYESGIGVKKDTVTAFKWFILAAENRHQLAASRVEDLSIDLSREQRERGAELVREHKQRFPKKT